MSNVMGRGLRFLRGRSRSVAAVSGLAICVALATFASSTAADLAGSGREVTIYAEASDAGALIQGNDVRMFGVKIGVVKKLEVVRNDTALLTLDITTAQTPIHDDATLRIRPVSLLGERYVDLDPGSVDAPLMEDGGTISAENVSRAVDLDEVLDTVDNPTGTALAMLLQTMGDGLSGNGENAADAITALGPSMKDADQLVSVLNSQTSTLQDLVDSLEPVVAAIGSRQGTTTDLLLDRAGELVSATAEQQSSLQATLDELPTTLVAAERTLAKLSGLADEATPALASARPFTDKLDDIAGEASDFADAASPAISTLKPVLDKARSLVKEAEPLVAQLNSSSAAMEADAANGARFLVDLSDHLSGLLDFITYWSLTTNGKDGLSHYFRVQVIVNGDTVTSLDPTGTLEDVDLGLPKNPQLPDVPNLPGLPDLPNLPDLSDLPGGIGLPDGNGLGLGGLGLGKGRKAAADESDSATGLTMQQESDLLGMLMGDAS